MRAPPYFNWNSRTAAAMAAFVGNHHCVSVINNHVPRDHVLYYTKWDKHRDQSQLLCFFCKEAAIWGETKASGRVGETFAQPCHEHEHTSCEVSFLSHKYTNTKTQPCQVSFPPCLIIWSDFAKGQCNLSLDNKYHVAYFLASNFGFPVSNRLSLWRIALHFRSNPTLLEKITSVRKVLELMSDREFKNRTDVNEVKKLRFTHF